MAISYIADIRSSAMPAEERLMRVGLYISLFPHLIAGPIVRYREIASDMLATRLSLENFAEGVQRFITGLGKKVLVADVLGSVADKIMIIPENELSAGLAWLGIVCYTFQIYYDFSGYSDMAIGLARIFGFHFPENFAYPYISQSIREFWQRWHMTLSRWFRDYVYIPLGGSYQGKLRTYRNLLIVFGLCGIWHGASWNFLIWGLYYGFFLILERLGLGLLLARVWRPLRHAYSMLVVSVGWVFFRIQDLHDAMRYVASLFGFCVGGGQEYCVEMYLDSHILLILVIATLGACPICPWASNYLKVKTGDWVWATEALSLCSSCLVLILSVLSVASSTYNPFIYFRF
jgi:alginate O-acetyltransferase complex protein AlgI